ncbi:osmoprotectant ABC transporter substrate-binding protein [Paenibacillus albiflavus]|uniref:Osmoprotectant ABC transporter substrate-binding protein n=1 Tax=Paenibacillus albiflavus TaxID=2545760 RepID=A0A4R4ENP7_9BACL|nr:glycine betaine ABC transporter substrate-binding protein [Paenibacillus albiflavus]TCZ80161.1 osmoprotectant ABC transporter substrate-binding protein [Paenibacillus albiflavus]
MKKNKIIITSLLLSLLLLLSACGSSKDASSGGKKITIGTQTYSEPKIIAEMYKALIEDRSSIKVKIVTDLAASPIVIKAMQSNEIQMATLYTGEILNGYFDVTGSKDRQEVLAQAKEGFDKKFGFTWFDPFGFENTYAFTVRKDLVDQYNLKTVSDLKEHAGSMRLGVDTTWLEREVDGYRAFSKLYEVSFKETFPMEISLVYKAVADSKVDVVLAYTTDPGIQEYNLQTLEDDKQFFPPYDASPVIKKEALEQMPELKEIIPLLIGKIDAATMTSLNYEVDVNKRNPNEVAVEFLRANGLLK